MAVAFNSDEWVHTRPHYVTGTAATDGSNVTLVTLTCRNAQGRAVGPKSFFLYLSDSASAVGYSATTASGAVTVKTAGTTGTLLGTRLAKFGLDVQTLANGTFQLSITDTAKTAFKVCADIDGVAQVAITLAAASYG